MKHIVILAVMILTILGCSENKDAEEKPIGIPTNLGATCGVSSEVFLSWDLAYAATTYYIYRTGSPSYTVTQIGTSTTNSYHDLDVKDGYYYYYQVQAYSDAKGYSDYSTMVKGYTMKVGDTWASLMSLTPFSPRELYQAVIFDSKIWVIGGYDGHFVQKYDITSSFIPSTFKNDIWYTSDTLNWSCATEHPLFENLSNHASAAVVFNNKIWVIGGRQVDGSYNNDVWYSDNGKDWYRATGTADFGGRAGHRAVSFNGYMWVIGGFNGDTTGTGFKSDVWRSTDGATWTCIKTDAGFTGRVGFSLLVFNGKLWVIGGYYCTYSSAPSTYGQIMGEYYNSEVWSSDDGITWNLVTNSASQPRWYQAYTVHNGKMWIMGGEYSTNQGLGLVPSADGDETTLSYPTPLTNHWAQVHDSTQDGDTTRVSTEGAAEGTYRDLYNIPDHGSAVGTIKNLRIFWMLKRSGTGANARGAIKTNGTVYETSNLNPVVGSYRGYNHIWTTNPDTGLAWTWTEIDNLQVGVTLVSHNGYAALDDAYCTQIAIFIDYDDTSLPYLSGYYNDTWSSSDGLVWTEESFNDEVKPRGGHSMVSFEDKLLVLPGLGLGDYISDIWYR